MSDEPVKILIVDDTVVYRQILSQAIDSISGATVLATAPNGKIALAKMKANLPDLVLLDVEMPVMGGLETLEAIKAAYPDVGVIMVSGISKNAAAITLKALNEGALDFIPKPEGSAPQESRAILSDQLKRLIVMFNTRMNLRSLRKGEAEPRARATRRTPTKKGPAVETPVKARAVPRPKRFDVVVIGVSTGGPNALAKVIPALPGNLGVPVLLVQHMPPLFTASLAESLDKHSALRVREAKDSQAIKANEVLIAPGGKHMIVRSSPSGDRQVTLNENPPEHSCRPSVDVLFRSVAANYSGNILGIVMTGMGSDGRDGIRSMKRRGCLCLTQDAASCVVYGMPHAVDQAGLSDESVPLNSLAARIVGAVKGK